MLDPEQEIIDQMCDLIEKSKELQREHEDVVLQFVELKGQLKVVRRASSRSRSNRATGRLAE